MSQLTIENHGPLILRTNYWATNLARHGKLFLSSNAGAFRLLVPDSSRDAIQEMRSAVEVIVSRGPWPDAEKSDAVELLFEDRSDSPYSIHLDLCSLDRLPADSDTDQPWIFSAWVSRGDRPHKALERPAWYRRVARLPACSREDDSA